MNNRSRDFLPLLLFFFSLSLKAAAASLVTLAGACTCNSNFICMALFLLIKGTFTGFAVYGNGLTSASCVYADFLHFHFFSTKLLQQVSSAVWAVSPSTRISPLEQYSFYYTHMFLLYNLMLASFYLLNSYFISDSISPFSKFIPKFLIF